MNRLGKREPEWMKSIRARLISSNMNRWLGIQFIFYCDYLGSRFEYFNIIKADIFENSHESEKEFLRKLKLMKVIDVELVKLVQLIQAYFKWMLLLIITLDVIDITINVRIYLYIKFSLKFFLRFTGFMEASVLETIPILFVIYNYELIFLNLLIFIV